MEKMNADTRIKLAIGSQFVEIQQLQDHVQNLLAENEELKKSAALKQPAEKVKSKS